MSGRMLAVLAAGLFLAADNPKDEAVQKEFKQLAGTWKPVSYELDGQKPVTDEQLAMARLTMTADGKIKVAFGDMAILEGATKIDPSKTPKTVDIKFQGGDMDGKTSLGIYELKGDTYRLCRAAPGKERPKEFSSKAGSDHTLVVYQRVQAK